MHQALLKTRTNFISSLLINPRFYYPCRPGYAYMTFTCYIYESNTAPQHIITNSPMGHHNIIKTTLTNIARMVLCLLLVGVASLLIAVSFLSPATLLFNGAYFVIASFMIFAAACILLINAAMTLYNLVRIKNLLQTDSILSSKT